MATKNIVSSKALDRRVRQFLTVLPQGKELARRIKQEGHDLNWVETFSVENPFTGKGGLYNGKLLTVLRMVCRKSDWRFWKVDYDYYEAL